MGAADSYLLDAYSQTVSGVIERASPSVAAVRVGGSNAALGNGSGFVFTSDGYLLTNSHVVRAGRSAVAVKSDLRYSVVLGDGMESDAEWIGDDPDTDLALLRVGAAARVSLQPLVLGNRARSSAARSRSRSATRSASSTPPPRASSARSAGACAPAPDG